MHAQPPETLRPHSRADLLSIVTDMWAKIMAVPPQDIEIDANFFAMGGESLQVVQLCHRVNEVFFVDPDSELPVTDFFECSTVRALADHLALKLYGTEAAPHAAVAQSQGDEGHGVAIIGMSGRFPGARNIQEFWDNLCAGVESIQTFSDAQLRDAGVSDRLSSRSDYVKRGGPLNDSEWFDASYFGLTPREAANTTPEQRLLLECAEEALQNAGYGARDEDAGKVGVYLGAGHAAHGASLEHATAEDPGLRAALAVAGTSPATRISYLLDLCGPSLSLDTACSSSLVAVHQACRAILRGECTMALAGGASVRHTKAQGYLCVPGGIASPDGRCRPFDADAAGTVFTSGAGVVLLKRLEDARSDGDSICAVIRGTAINNDGRRKVGYTAPSALGQANVVRNALAAADVRPESVGYIETHGTGTPLGDSIEIAALKEVFGNGEADDYRCKLGALKSNVGHLEAAAGIAGLIKTALILHNRVIPPTINHRSASPAIDIARTPFELNTTPCEWLQPDQPRRAGVSSFGIGGTNAHAVLEEATSPPSGTTSRSCQLIVVSARTDRALRTSCAELAKYLSRPLGPSITNVAYTLHVGRQAHPHRAFVVCATIEQAVRALEKKSVAPPEREPVTDKADRPIVFVFSAEAFRAIDLLRDVYVEEAVFREHVDRCSGLLGDLLDTDIRDTFGSAAGGIQRPESSPETDDAALFVAQYALARQLQFWGIEPSTMIGQGVGRYVAASLSGLLSLDDALTLAIRRRRLTQEALRRELERLSFGRMRVPLASATTAERISATVATSPEYWLDEAGDLAGIRNAAIEQLVSQRNILLGIGPSSVVRSLVERAPALNTQMIGVGSARISAAESGGAALQRALGEAWQAGVRVDWQAVHQHDSCNRVALPTYPFDRQSLHGGSSAAIGPANDASVRRSDPHDWFYVPTWKRLPRQVAQQSAEPMTTADRRSCCVIFERERELGSEITPALHATFKHVIRVRPAQQFGKIDGGYTVDPLEKRHYSALFAQLERDAMAPDTILLAWNAALDETETPTIALESGIRSIVRLCQALAEELPGRAVTLALVTNNGHAVIGDEALRPEHGSLAAACRVVASEFPNIRCCAIDVATKNRDVDDASAASIVARLVDSTHSTTVACRGPSQWIREFEPLRPVDSGGDRTLLRRAGVYLITGGLGAIGLALAEHLAARVEAKLVLVARTALPERGDWERWLAEQGREDRLSRAIGRIQRMQSNGAQVRTIQADVTDAAQVGAAMRLAQQEFGGLNGVIHAAGIVAGGTIQSKTDETLHSVLAPKVDGTQILVERSREFDLDFFVCCSSLAAVLSPAGLIDYVAANAFQDAFMEACDAGSRTTHFVSINWDGWREAGMAVDAGVAVSHGISPDEGKTVFDLVLANPRPQWVICTRDIDYVRAQSRAAKRQTNHRETDADRKGNGETPPANRIESELLQLWKELLGIEEIDPSADFFDLGGDSLLAVSLDSQLQSRRLGAVDLKELIEHSSIEKLAKFLSQQRQQ